MRRPAALAVALVIGSLLFVVPAAAGSGEGTPPMAGVVIPNLGFGYAVVSQGSLSASEIAGTSPNPTGAVAALAKLSRAGSIATYQRLWQDTGHNNEVQDLVVRFATTGEAERYATSVEHALAAAEVVSSGPLTAIPGAFRATYFALTSTQVGVGQAIAMRQGLYVATMSFFSANTPTNTTRITQQAAQTLAGAQYDALPRVTPTAVAVTTPPHKNKVLGWIALAIGIIALGDLALIALRAQQRRRHARGSWIG